MIELLLDLVSREGTMGFQMLIVDDDEIVRLQLSQAIQELGEVHTATTGQEGLDLSFEVKPDLIFLDITLPDINGFKIMKTLKSTPSLRHIPIIIVTAYSFQENHIQAIKLGAIAFLSKPLEPTTIKELVRDQIEKKTYQKAKHAEIIDRYDELDYIMGMLSNAVIITDESGVIEYVNQYGLNLFGYDNQDLLGTNIQVLVPPLSKTLNNIYHVKYQETRQAHLIGKPRSLEARTKSGKKLNIELSLSEYISDITKRYIGIITDLTQKEESDSKLLRSAMADSLTGLSTLNAFRNDAKSLSELERQDGYIVAFMSDFDEFQKFNAVFGHEIGDLVLKSIGKVLRQISEQENIAAYRIMSDRFILCLCTDTEESAKQAKSRLITILENAINVMRSELELPISITTVCLVTPTIETREHSLIHYLEMALKTARTSGKQGAIYKASNLGFKHNMQLASLALSLSENIDKSKLSIVLQPKVNSNLQISSYEALLRWFDSEFDTLNLRDFIDACETTSSIIEVGHFVVEEVCKFLVQQPKSNRKKVFVNLSIRQLSEQRFLERIQDTCSFYDIGHNELGFELTESMIGGDISVVRDRLINIRKAGFEIAVDDFGTGQSNLKYLHRLPISCLKIDKSFIDDIIDSNQSYPLVDTVFAIAKGLGLTTVAEGVETLEQANYLRHRNVDEIQGFYYFKPMSPDAVLKLTQTENTLDEQHYSR